MNVDYQYVKRVILNDRLLGYKPDRASLDKLRDRLPDANVIGYGIYSIGLFKTWYLLVESKTFWADYTGSIQSIPITQLPTKQILLSAVPNNFTPKPSA